MSARVTNRKIKSLGSIPSVLLSPFANNEPDENHEGQHNSRNVKIEESHGWGSLRAFALSTSAAAMARKNAVAVMPAATVGHGTAAATAGIKAPTTSDPKIILAPSRKKLEIMRRRDSDSMSIYATTQFNRISSSRYSTMTFYPFLLISIGFLLFAFKAEAGLILQRPLYIGLTS